MIISMLSRGNSLIPKGPTVQISPCGMAITSGEVSRGKLALPFGAQDLCNLRLETEGQEESGFKIHRLIMHMTLKQVRILHLSSRRRIITEVAMPPPRPCPPAKPSGDRAQKYDDLASDPCSDECAVCTRGCVNATHEFRKLAPGPAEERRGEVSGCGWWPARNCAVRTYSKRTT